MIARKSIVGLFLLCALAAGAFAAQASGASKGTTMFTCKKGSEGTGERFSKAHCRGDSDTSPTGEYRHIAVAQDTTTEITGTSENTEGVCQAWILRSTQAGNVMEISSPCAHTIAGESWATNKIDGATGEHYVEGEARVSFTEVSITKPGGKGCKVKTGSLTSNKIKFTSLGLGDEFKIEAAVGSVLVSYEVEGCSIGALNGLYETTGSVKVPVNGSTVSATEAGTTAQGTLKMRGQKAGAEGEMTVKGKAPSDETYTALSVTTVETP